MAAKPLEYGLTPPDQLIELADSMRAVIEKMMVIDREHPHLREARATLDDIAARLDGLGRRGFHARMMPEVDPGEEDLRPYFAGNARRWHYNPIHPPMELEPKAGGLRARVRLGLAYEGPPGCVHGGLIAMLLDQVLGQSNFENGVAGMTGTLTVRYRRPTPLLRELIVEADAPELADNRKCVTRGRILCDGEVTAEAQALFVLPSGNWVLPAIKPTRG